VFNRHFIVSCAAAACLSACVAAALTAPAFAETQPPVASPAPSPAPSGPSDPCTAMLAIVTRPTVTTSVCVVKPDHLLLETGWTNTVTAGPGGGNTAAYPQALVRIPTNIRRIEFDWTPPTYERSSVGGTVVGGASDMAFGAKWEAGYNAKSSWGANAFVTVPSGDAAFTAGGTQYTVNVNGSYALNSVFSLGSTLGFNSLTGFGSNGSVQRFTSFVPSLVLTAGLPNSSQPFVEYAYFSHAGLGLGGKSLVDFGYARDFGQHVQADVEYGVSPTKINGQTQHYLGAGLSFML